LEEALAAHLVTRKEALTPDERGRLVALIEQARSEER